jgi:hypothetical protein
MSLGMVWSFEPVRTNYGKAIVVGSFEAPPWAGELLVWATGEAELATVRLSDGLVVNKHYDLATSDDLQTAVAELAELVARNSVPPGAATTRIEPTE